MATDGQPLERIGELLHVAVGPLDLSVKTVLQDAMERVVAALRYFLSPSICLHSFFIYTIENTNSTHSTDSEVVQSSQILSIQMYTIFPLRTCTMAQIILAVQLKELFSILENTLFGLLWPRFG